MHTSQLKRFTSTALMAMLLITPAACGGSSDPSPAIGCPTQQPGSGSLPAPLLLIYPQPGSTAVPDGGFTAVVAYGGPPSGVLSFSGGATNVTAGPWGTPPSPMPSPAATVPPGDYLFGASVGPLQAATQYTAEYQVGQTGPCNPPTLIGTFKTK